MSPSVMETLANLTRVGALPTGEEKIDFLFDHPELTNSQVVDLALVGANNSLATPETQKTLANAAVWIAAASGDQQREDRALQRLSVLQNES